MAIWFYLVPIYRHSIDCFSLWTPVRFYIPKVVIAKNIAKIAKQESSSDDSRKCLISEIVVGILIGIILMIIEQNIDLTFIK